jgi:hypothetical protein
VFRMSTLSRATAKALLKSLNLYETQKEMVEKAVDPVKPTLVKSHARNRIKLESSFTDLSLDWKTFKADLDLPRQLLMRKKKGYLSTSIMMLGLRKLSWITLSF